MCPERKQNTIIFIIVIINTFFIFFLNACENKNAVAYVCNLKFKKKGEVDSLKLTNKY